ncbi:hypothetical protein E2C01_011096 [Portunus trituberculatus]|uniref:Uncharacterized protein n=1 Tax=Portunus trituberculatus TaxID=210409 RepID=A0A5B7DAE1_PORTR|nr:hypothetical protein [Portunus trituberculatus]
MVEQCRLGRGKRRGAGRGETLQADVSPCTLARAALLVLGAVAVRSAGALLFGVTISQEKRSRGPTGLRNKASDSLLSYSCYSRCLLSILRTTFP